MQKQEKKRENAGTVRFRAAGELGKGVVIAAGTALGLALLCAVGISFSLLEEHWLGGLSAVCCAAGALAGGSFAVRAVGRSPLPVGLAVGVLLFLLLLTAGEVTAGTVLVQKYGLPILTACLGGGAGAGILARPPKKKRRR